MIYTIGYAGYKDFDNLFRKLKENNIEHVIDVRQFAKCKWQPDFDKENLDICLNLKNIAYTNYKHLGIPPHIRAEKDLKKAKYFYQFILKNNEKTLKVIGNFAEILNICLLCAEKDYQKCHRTWIAEWIKDRNEKLDVKHL